MSAHWLGNTQEGILMINLPRCFPELGWNLIGQYESNVGSWLLYHEGEALLLEIPEGLKLCDVRHILKTFDNPRLKYITSSHSHEDHLDTTIWDLLQETYPRTEMIDPSTVFGYTYLRLGGEPLFLLRAPKHSWNDIVVVFRGIAMVGDIELGMLESVNNEVPSRVKAKSMKTLANFSKTWNYKIHHTISAHLDDCRYLRNDEDWYSLFHCKELSHV